MFFVIIPHITSKLFTLFGIWFFTIDISYTIHLLINSFLTLDKHSVDLILVHYLIISLQLCCFCMESLFQLFYHCFYFFFLYVILPFKFLIFYVPPYLFSLVAFQDVYVFPDFIYPFYFYLIFFPT